MTHQQLHEAMRWSAAERGDFRAMFPRLHSDVEPRSTWSMDHVSCGRGWRALIERVFAVAEADRDARVGQVKEKWGSLRIYFDKRGSDSALWRLVTEMQKESEATCEACGAPGSLVQLPSSWMKTLCVSHLPDGASRIPDLANAGPVDDIL